MVSGGSQCKRGVCSITQILLRVFTDRPNNLGTQVCVVGGTGVAPSAIKQQGPMLTALLLALSQPSPDHKEATARWMVATLTYGSLSTTSTRSEASKVGDAFGNPYSYADVGGIPYLYASDLDSSMIDLFTASTAKTRGSLALSEATLTHPNGTSIIGACEIGSGLGDPENVSAFGFQPAHLDSNRA